MGRAHPLPPGPGRPAGRRPHPASRHRLREHRLGRFGDHLRHPLATGRPARGHAAPAAAQVRRRARPEHRSAHPPLRRPRRARLDRLRRAPHARAGGAADRRPVPRSGRASAAPGRRGRPAARRSRGGRPYLAHAAGRGHRLVQGPRRTPPGVPGVVRRARTTSICCPSASATASTRLCGCASLRPAWNGPGTRSPGTRRSRSPAPSAATTTCWPSSPAGTPRTSTAI